MNGSIKHDDAVAFGLNVKTDNRACSAREKQQARQGMFIEYPHDGLSFSCGLALVGFLKERAKAVPVFEYLVDSMAYGYCPDSLCRECFNSETKPCAGSPYLRINRSGTRVSAVLYQ
ncbi:MULTISPECIES: hypothetical protein [Pseudomonas]|uniref:hypothetical protein n=1 Tax=Pseudomonas TaxID=286 RepID=UPI001CD7BB0B|nr:MULTISPECIES: hypothetical protein [Pseudomonas]